MDSLNAGGEYFNNLFLNSFTDDAKTHLRRVNFDTMVGIGFSGVLAVAKLSIALNKNGFYLRKKGESTHSCFTEEGTFGSRWIFVDDFIATGESFARVYKRVKEFLEFHNHKSEFVGAYIYQGGSRGKEGFYSPKRVYLTSIFEEKEIMK